MRGIQTALLFGLLSGVLVVFFSCGVKGPPLPPVSATPQDSDFVMPSPRPRPSASPSLKPKTKARPPQKKRATE